MADVVWRVTPFRPSRLFERPEHSGKYAIRCLIPDLPRASDLLPYLERIDQNRWYSNFGPLLQQYENRLSEITGGHCVTLSSGTAALELGIAALDLPPGSPVLLPSFGFPAALLALLRCGLKPIFCDVDPNTWTLTPEIALAAFAAMPCKLVLPLATFGHPLPVERWDDFAQATDARVLIDVGGAFGHQRVGRHVHLACSLHATKPLGIGEGGVFATSDADLAERVRLLTNYSLQRGAVTRPGGTNAKLSEYAAAVGLAQLARWPELLERRRSIWLKYSAGLSALRGVRVQSVPAGIPPALLSVSSPIAAAEIGVALAASSIETRRWSVPPLHHQPMFAAAQRIGGPSGTLPVTDDLARHHIGLPFHLFLSDENIRAVCDALAACLDKPTPGSG